ncbi:unnamed protein product [Durusdinium trenchii]|uniref:Uncharacterized protein n=1 Tax=Durusdinium trenchii TaxID=1381693 RepID=A0ABP0PG97_9DINO
MYDDAFLERLVNAWGFSERFRRLAVDLTPDVDSHQIQEVEKAIQEVAAGVWGEGNTLELIGSTRLGTAIRKRCGQSDRDYTLSIHGATVTSQEWKEFAKYLAEDARFRQVSVGRRAKKLQDQKLQLEWEVIPADGHFSFDLVTFPTLEGTTKAPRKGTDCGSNILKQHILGRRMQ